MILVGSLIEDYTNGLPVLLICSKHAIDRSTLYRYLHLHNVPLRSPTQSNRVNHGKRPTRPYYYTLETSKDEAPWQKTLQGSFDDCMSGAVLCIEAGFAVKVTKIKEAKNGKKNLG